ncbi:hypothetical protein BGZ51_002126 [Haplosporangium sp. Z 767]|nr:hypothetical protein BGZ51_002126 [Haplosporangium sp. Z 767]KAF9195182.1 hypothetical protein BGZ50_005016 [Haplosporangium sp. Z 11]
MQNNPYTSNIAIFKKLGIKKSTTQDMLKQRDEVLEQEAKLQPEVLKKRSWIVKRQMQPKEEILMDYITKCRDQDACIKETTLAMLQEINELYDHNLDADDISFSDGWFSNFKKANNLRQYVGHGESEDVDLSVHESVLNAIRE